MAVDDVVTQRANLVTYLEEIGVTSAHPLVEGLEDGQLHGAYGALFRHRDQTSDRYTPPIGPLVKLIREGGLPGYRRPHERTSLDGIAGAQTEDVMNQVRGMALGYRFGVSADDGTTREQVREMIAGIARRLQSPPDSLIDTAVHPAWTFTPPWPGQIWHPGDTKEIFDFRYRASMGLPHRATAGFPQREGETALEFAYRFWNYDELPEVAAFIQADIARRAELAREQARVAELQRVERERAEAEAELAAQRERDLEAQRQGPAEDNSPPSADGDTADQPELTAAPAAEPSCKTCGDTRRVTNPDYVGNDAVAGEAPYLTCPDCSSDAKPQGTGRGGTPPMASDPFLPTTDPEDSEVPWC